MKKPALLIFATLAIAMFTAVGAQAHARLQGSVPAVNAMTGSPKAITLHFNEKLAGKLSSFELTMADGMRVSLKPHPAGGSRDLTATVRGRLMPGAYKVKWHVVTTDDGHRTTGEYNFTVK